MRISDWSSDVCGTPHQTFFKVISAVYLQAFTRWLRNRHGFRGLPDIPCTGQGREPHPTTKRQLRSEEHTSELQSLMRISYAVFCLKKTKLNNNNKYTTHIPTYVRKTTY